jgi:hypothetical protein
VFDLRISLTAKAQAKPSPEEKIAEWFKHNPLAKPGTLREFPIITSSRNKPLP